MSFPMKKVVVFIKIDRAKFLLAVHWINEQRRRALIGQAE